MIPQLPIKDYKEVVFRIMNHLFGKNTIANYGCMYGGGWHSNSPAHRYWNYYCKKNFNILKKLSWRDIYKLARQIRDED